MPKKTKTSNKLHAKKITIDNILFDSKLEGDYYCWLKEMKAENIIKDFELKPTYILVEGFTKNGIKHLPVTYTPDFRIINHDGSSYLVDTKGKRTDVFNIKYKLFCKRYNEELKLIAWNPYTQSWDTIQNIRKMKLKKKREAQKRKAEKTAKK